MDYLDEHEESSVYGDWWRLVVEKQGGESKRLSIARGQVRSHPSALSFITTCVVLGIHIYGQKI